MANEDAGLKKQISAADGGEDGDTRAHATGARKPGLIGRMVERSRSAVESIRLPRPDWRTFAWGLLALIAIAFIIRNWAPLRINLFGWYFDAPRAVVLVIVFLLGMITAWLLEVRARGGRGEEEAQEEEAVEAATDETQTDEASEPGSTPEESDAEAAPEEPETATGASAEAADEEDLFPEDEYDAEHAESVSFNAPDDLTSLDDPDLPEESEEVSEGRDADGDQITE